ncbi:MAG: hypothetical protein Q9226_009410, partial [Calogaya cf. arnoldii]
EHVASNNNIDNNNKNGAIPHTFGAYDHVTEAEHVANSTLASHNDNNNKNGAIPHTFGAYNHVTEVGHEDGGAHKVTDGGILRLLGESRGVLTQAQRERFEKDGFIVLPSAFDDSQGTDLL